MLLTTTPKTTHIVSWTSGRLLFAGHGGRWPKKSVSSASVGIPDGGSSGDDCEGMLGEAAFGAVEGVYLY